MNNRIERLREALEEVWAQAEDNHRRYSNTGDLENNIRFLTLGLAGEAGELANFVKKRWRDGDGHDEDIRLEISDVCAYAFMLASTMRMSPTDLIATIADKQQVFVAKMKALGFRCDHCGVAQQEATTERCAPPFQVQPHSFTGQHPADRAALAANPEKRDG